MAYLVMAYMQGVGVGPATGTPLLLSISGTLGNTTSSDQYAIAAAGWPAVTSTSAETLPSKWSMLIKRTGGAGFGGTLPFGAIGMRVAGYTYADDASYSGSYPHWESDQCEGGNWTNNSASPKPVGQTWLLIHFDQDALETKTWWGSTIPDPDVDTPKEVRVIPNANPGKIHIRPYSTAANFQFAYGLHKWTADPF